jgi:hypothetical protein
MSSAGIVLVFSLLIVFVGFREPRLVQQYPGMIRAVPLASEPEMPNEGLLAVAPVEAETETAAA